MNQYDNHDEMQLHNEKLYHEEELNKESLLHNIKWYKAHPKITAKEIKWCNSKAQRKSEIVCKNATKAMDYIQIHNFLSPPKGGFVAGGSDGRIVVP